MMCHGSRRTRRGHLRFAVTADKAPTRLARVWFRDVDVPAVLVQAARDKRLVFFVGAGASIAAPANLPGFGALVEQIGISVGSPPEEGDYARPDLFLGRLADRDIKVHDLVHAAIDDPDSAPNALHRAIVDVARAHGPLRVVTTNYDRHLAVAARAVGLDPHVYFGPAVPLGNDFDGIVHLHGELDQESRHLILTDSDFGRAYLRDAWASRFLERMFATYTVVFIGYSHGDIIVQYLARSLGPSGTRFVMTHEPDSAAWRSYGLLPVAYTTVEGSHESLPDALAQWAATAALGSTDHRQRIRGLVSQPPPSIPEDISYLEEVLGHPERVRYFAEYALEPAWLTWAAERPEFGSLFAPTGGLGASSVQAGPIGVDEQVTEALARWVVDRFVVEEEHTRTAMGVLRGRQWAPVTVHTVAHRLFLQDPVPIALLPWVTLLLDQAPPGRSNVLDLLLEAPDWAGQPEIAVMLFEHRTRPRPTGDGYSWLDPQTTRFAVEFAGSAYNLTSAWEKTFKPLLTPAEPVEGEESATGQSEPARVAVGLLDVAVRQIRSAYQQLRTLNSTGRAENLSWHRAAIEPHDQDSFREPVDALIDAARDCLEALLGQRPGWGVARMDEWTEAKEALLRRLAVHGWRIRSDVNDDDKLNWLMERDWLYDLEAQHEVYRLLADCLPGATEETVGRLAVAADTGPISDGAQSQSGEGAPLGPDPAKDDLANLGDENVTGIVAGAPVDNDEGGNSGEAGGAVLSEPAAQKNSEQDSRRRSDAYRRFNLLAWMKRHHAANDKINEALAAIAVAHPDFLEREHPDLNIYVSAGFVEDAEPYTVDELHHLLATEPESALAQLFSHYGGDDFAVRGITWSGALASLRACVVTHPEDGFIVAGNLVAGATVAARTAGNAEFTDEEHIEAEADILQGVRRCLINAWSEARLNETQVGHALAMIATWPTNQVRDSAAQMLAWGGQSGRPTHWERHPFAQALAQMLWPAEPVDGDVVDRGRDPAEAVLNHPVGNLTEFWMHLLAEQWRVHEDTWSGIPADLSNQLEKLLEVDGYYGRLVKTVFAGQLPLLYAADPEWAMTHVVPLLDWTQNAPDLDAAWSGFLVWGRPTENLLSAGILDGYLTACGRLEDLEGPDTQHSRGYGARLAEALAQVALYSAIDPATWLPRFVAAATEAMLEEWTNQVSWMLDQGTAEQAETQWNRWMCRYWTDRANSVPAPMTAKEASTTAEWVLVVPQHIATVESLVDRTRASIGDSSNILSRLAGATKPARQLGEDGALDESDDFDDDDDDDGPTVNLHVNTDAWVRYLTHLLVNTVAAGPTASTRVRWQLDYHLRKIMVYLKGFDPAPELTPLIEAAMQLGCTDAPDW